MARFSSEKSRNACQAISIVVTICTALTLQSLWGDAPFDAPASVHVGSPRPVVVALGDSLTHGVVSHNWMRDLKEQFPRVNFVNAARCGHTAHAVLKVARSLKLHKPPELAIILVGTNDALAAMSPGWRSFYVKSGHLPADAPARLGDALAAYERNLNHLVSEARAGLGAKKVVIVSPPPFGNGRSSGALPKGSAFGDLERQPNDLARQVARRAARVARWRGAHFVDLHAALSKRLAREPQQPGTDFTGSAAQLFRQLYRAVAVAYVPGLTFNRLSSTPFLHDHIHLNGRGAEVLREGLDPIVAAVAARGGRP